MKAGEQQEKGWSLKYSGDVSLSAAEFFEEAALLSDVAGGAPAEAVTPSKKGKCPLHVLVPSKTSPAERTKKKPNNR